MAMEDLQISPDEIVELVESRFAYLEHEHRRKLAKLLNLDYSTKPQTVPSRFSGSEPIDMLSEVQEQMQMLRLLREQITKSGLDANPKDLQSLVTTSTSLFAMLTKYSNDMINQDRIKKIEEAVVTVVRELPSELQEEFFRKLEEKLNE